MNSINGCWNWKAALDRDGYGTSFRDENSKKWKPHRWSYQFFTGHDIEFQSLHIHHICGNRRCVNPDRLSAITIEHHNSLKSLKPCCKRGHAFKGDNLALSVKGHRVCRECNRIKARRHKEKTN